MTSSSGSVEKKNKESLYTCNRKDVALHESLTHGCLLVLINCRVEMHGSAGFEGVEYSK